MLLRPPPAGPEGYVAGRILQRALHKMGQKLEFSETADRAILWGRKGTHQPFADIRAAGPGWKPLDVPLFDAEFSGLIRRIDARRRNMTIRRWEDLLGHRVAWPGSYGLFRRWLPAEGMGPAADQKQLLHALRHEKTDIIFLTRLESLILLSRDRGQELLLLPGTPVKRSARLWQAPRQRPLPGLRRVLRAMQRRGEKAALIAAAMRPRLLPPAGP